MLAECFVMGCMPLSPPCVARTSVIADAECNIRRGILLEIPVLLCIWPGFARAQGHKHGPVPDPGFLQIREHCSRRGGDGRLDPSNLFAHPPLANSCTIYPAGRASCWHRSPLSVASLSSTGSPHRSSTVQREPHSFPRLLPNLTDTFRV